MCGIAGFQFRRAAGDAEGTLRRLSEALHHRGPDALGVFEHERTALLNTRLAIMDVAHGDQPFVSPAGTVLVANGEIYNSRALRAQHPDYPYRSDSDCESILPAYEARKDAFVERLRGMFAIALYDPARRELRLCRDPFGIKPLYCVENDDGFAFASEPQALIAAGLASNQVDPTARDELLQLKYVTGRRTIFSGIERVLPGETLLVRDGRVVGRTTHEQVRPSVAGSSRTRRRARVAEFDTVIRDAVAAHMVSDVPWTLFYSGGVDSTVLLAAAAQVGDAPLNVLTVGYEGQETVDESRDAVRLAKGLGADCERVEMTADDFWRLAPRIAAAVDDPTADPAVLPTYRLGQAARAAGYKVAVTGEGADEMFGGYSRYRKARLPLLFRRKPRRRGVFSRSGLPRAAFSRWDEGIAGAETHEAGRWPSRLQVLQAVDMKERLPNSLLIKLDRCLMAHGVEGRTPFLDREVLAFAAGLPDSVRTNLSIGKLVLRDWLAQAYPQARPYARKRGFSVPLASWMQPRSALLTELVSAQPGVSAVFAPEVVGAVFARVGEEEQAAWSLLYFALWHSAHVLGVSAEGDVADVLRSAARAA